MTDVLALQVPRFKEPHGAWLYSAVDILKLCDSIKP